VALYLDLFTGGALEHDVVESWLVCHRCPYAVKDSQPACEMHLGVIEAFHQGMLGTRHSARRIVDKGECRIACDETIR
jgi:hypothetical protein